MAWGLSLIKHLHGRFVSDRRARVLAQLLAADVPKRASVLDVGCGDGTIAHLLRQQIPSLSVQGLEVMARPHCLIDYNIFDGTRIPHEDASFDVYMFVDVLHHTEDIETVLKEGCRVSRRYVLMKEEMYENALDYASLKFMDWVGNRPHGVNLPYNFQTRKQWLEHFASSGLQIVAWRDRIPLYPFPFNTIFSRNLHFIALLSKEADAAR